MKTMSTDHLSADDANSADGDGVWPPDIEQSFQEALVKFPAVGRRKTILPEEGAGKMYGRNELIARYILIQTGKSRTRKQVSSHIQVLARRRARSEASTTSTASTSATPSPSAHRNLQAAPQQVVPDKRHDEHLFQTAYYDVWADRPIVTQRIRLVQFSAFIEHRNFLTPHIAPDSVAQPPMASLRPDQAPELVYPQPRYPPASQQTHLPSQLDRASYQASQHQHNYLSNHHHMPTSQLHAAPQNHILPANSSSAFVRHSYVHISYPMTIGRQANSKLERIDIGQIQDKFPEIGGLDGLFQRGPSDAFFLVKFWGDLNNDFEYSIDDQNSYFGFSSHFETVDPYKYITCSTKACSFGDQVVEKVDIIYGASSPNGRYSYNLNRSPMCEFMIQFIKKLSRLSDPSQMNIVLENFTVLQVITSESTSEILLCLAYVFEVAPSLKNSGPQHHVYRLTRD